MNLHIYFILSLLWEINLEILDTLMDLHHILHLQSSKLARTNFCSCYLNEDLRDLTEAPDDDRACGKRVRC